MFRHLSKYFTKKGVVSNFGSSVAMGFSEPAFAFLLLCTYQNFFSFVQNFLNIVFTSLSMGDPCAVFVYNRLYKTEINLCF